jgi:hypothetical protein
VLSSYSVRYHVTGPWQPNSPLLPILGPFIPNSIIVPSRTNLAFQLAFQMATTLAFRKWRFNFTTLMLASKAATGT